MDANLNDLLIHEPRRPYYIFSPSYTDQSAGIKVLHYLCHYLNISGYPAFLTLKKFNSNYKVNPSLITPVLNHDVINNHKQHNLNPIVIYPDIAKRNYFGEKTFFRYLLNYPGLLGGPKIFDSKEIIFTYSKKISETLNQKNHVLFFPVINTKIFFNDNKQDRDKNLSYFYASKYQLFHKQEPFPITDKSIEITRNKVDSPSQYQIANFLRKAWFFATYEDTSLITESILCGCPVLLIKNKFFNGVPLAIDELGIFGCFSDTNKNNLENNILKAHDEIPLAIAKYQESLIKFKSSLENFIDITQSEALKHDFPADFKIEKFMHSPKKEISYIKRKIWS